MLTGYQTGFIVNPAGCGQIRAPAAGFIREGAGGWVRFRLYLRPWGMEWEDVRTGDTSGCLYRNMLPPDYDSWYAPLLAQGPADMPDSFESAE